MARPRYMAPVRHAAPRTCQPEGRLRSAVLLVFSLILSVDACVDRPAPITRLSIATGGTGGVYYPYGGGVAKVISSHVPGVEATAEVTAGSVDNLKFLRDGQADLGFTLADSLDDAVHGRGVFADGPPIPIRALAVLYANYTHIGTFADSGISRIADLAGKVVSTGAPGSGTEIIARRILEAAGVDPDRKLRRHALGAAQSVDALKDGKIDAFFWSGGLPTASVLDLATTSGRTLRLLPNSEVLPALRERFGSLVYEPLTIPASAYPGLPADVPVVGVNNILAVHERMDPALAYEITRALFEHTRELEVIHAEAKSLTLQSAVVGSPAPFHEGARRFYRERGYPPPTTP